MEDTEKTEVNKTPDEIVREELRADIFLKHCQNVMDNARMNGYVYGDSHAIPPTADKIISCDRLVAKALWDMGYTDQPVSAETTSGITVQKVDEYLPKFGFIKVTDPADIQPGAVVNVKQKGGDVVHTFVVIQYDHETGLCDKYDAGSDERIRYAQPYRKVQLVEWSDREFAAAYNLPIQI